MSKLYLSKKVKELREHKGYTQENVCELLEIGTEKAIPIVTYRKWENGTNPVLPIIILEIAKAFQVATSEVAERR